jgi:hypothetical protein
MTRIFVVFSLLALSACASTPDQFAKSIASELELSNYNATDLKDHEVKTKTAFIYTLLENTQELRVHQFNGAYHNEVYVKNESVNGGYPELVVKFERV